MNTNGLPTFTQYSETIQPAETIPPEQHSIIKPRKNDVTSDNRHADLDGVVIEDRAPDAANNAGDATPS